MIPDPTPHAAPRIGLLSNPHSRRNRARLAAIGRIVANHPRIHHRVTESADEIGTALQDFADRGVDTLAINGGDGTTAQVFTELLQQRPFEQLPSVILLPGGTTNMNAGDVGLRGSLRKAVRRMADWAASGEGAVERLRRPILRASGAVEGKTVCGMFFGAGTIIRGIEYCHRRVHTLGLTDELGPGVVTARTIWGIARRDPYFSAPTPMRIEIDDTEDTREREVVLLLITSLERLFLGLRPWWGREQAPLHCSRVEKPARHVFRAFASVLRGRPNALASEDNGYVSHNGNEIRLWLDGAFTLDGEIYHAESGHGPLTVDNGGFLEFIRIGRGRR